MRLTQIKAAAVFAVALTAAAFGVSPAQADPQFAIDFTASSGFTGVGGFALGIPTLPNFTNIASDVSAFNVVINGATFDLANGSVSTLRFFDGALTGFDYSGQIGSGSTKQTLKIDFNLSGLINIYTYTDGTRRIIGTPIVEGTGDVDFAAVPEPSSLWLLLAGIAAFAGFAFFRRKQVSKPQPA